MGGNGIPALNTLAGQLMGTAIVLLAIALTWAIVRFASGSGMGKEAKSKGAAGIILCLVGAVIVGSTGAAIEWGSTVTKPKSLMGGEQINIRVEKEKAKTTCDNTVDKGFKDVNEKAASDQLVKGLISDKDFAAYSRKTSDKGTTTVVSWVPQGPDCTSENTVAEPCTEVKVTDLIVAGANRVENKYKSRSDKSCS